MPTNRKEQYLCGGKVSQIHACDHKHPIHPTIHPNSASNQRMLPTHRLPPATLLSSLLLAISFARYVDLASAVTVVASTETETTTSSSSHSNDPSCFSLSTSEKDCLLTITSYTCEWVYDDTGTPLCQDVTTTTTTTSTIVSNILLTENYKYVRPPRNEIRFTPWNQLSRELQALATGSLRYTKSTWDILGSNSIEHLRFDDLSDEQKEVAMALGFEDDFSWNCWQVSVVAKKMKHQHNATFKYLNFLPYHFEKESLGSLLMGTIV